MCHPVGFIGHLASIEGLLGYSEVGLRLGALSWGERPRYSCLSSACWCQQGTQTAKRSTNF